MKFTQKEVILFDLDGTLIDSVPDLAVAVNHMLKALHRETFSEDTIRYWVGNGAQMLVKRALSGQTEIDENLDPVLFEKALEIFLTFYGQNLCIDTAAYPNVSDTLHTLKEKGYRLVIVTNKPFDFVGPILKALGLDGVFDFWLGGDSLEKKKPDPLPLLHACEHMHVSVDQCVMVGDSKNDLLAANTCGMQSVGVTYGYNYGEEIGVYDPTCIINDFSELNALL
ncbi:phosphoglycolate phosphatase [Sulfurovum sp. XGS-02]|uniref:phosphoglycolate phosphatase n=1 Tax=Sulfurovum sp. XGS-02 TaxID=2925411 RepID=UPI00205E8456|nr:phosphoglycolate phosphatase [Sulfurovum sp. XGS-02]UPT78507.1 phosphoglycolate phosphatase [Sulfurovum sp. XGS-02]